MNFEVLMNELANVGLTILCVVVGVMIVNWLDRNVFNKNKWRDKQMILTIVLIIVFTYIGWKWLDIVFEDNE